MRRGRRGLKGCLLALAAWSLAGAAAGRVPKLLEARLNVFQPGCSDSRREDVLTAIRGASARLTAACRIRLVLDAWYGLPSDGPWCDLPGQAAQRSLRLQLLARLAKAPDPGALAVFLLPSDDATRYAWTLIDLAARGRCGLPHGHAALDRFGSLFFTDLCFSFGPDANGGHRPALLVLHEVLHALTQRGHPTHAPRGNVMADRVADIGSAVSPDWCACARQSPYVHAAEPSPAVHR